jgi:ADP-ribose pyrophosphatase
MWYVKVYKGYVDDPRNTDNSWMETVAMNAHDGNGKGIATLKLHAGDDAVNVCWMDVDSTLKLFASHTDFLHMVATTHKAHWD